MRDLAMFPYTHEVVHTPPTSLRAIYDQVTYAVWPLIKCLHTWSYLRSRSRAYIWSYLRSRSRASTWSYLTSSKMMVTYAVCVYILGRRSRWQIRWIPPPTGSLRAPYGLPTGSLRAPYGLPTGVRACHVFPKDGRPEVKLTSGLLRTSFWRKRVRPLESLRALFKTQLPGNTSVIRRKRIPRGYQR